MIYIMCVTVCLQSKLLYGTPTGGPPAFMTTISLRRKDLPWTIFAAYCIVPGSRTRCYNYCILGKKKFAASKMREIAVHVRTRPHPTHYIDWLWRNGSALVAGCFLLGCCRDFCRACSGGCCVPVSCVTAFLKGDLNIMAQAGFTRCGECLW